MTSQIASSCGSPPRRALVQPALPLVPMKQPAGRVGALTRANLKESTSAASNGTEKPEDSGASEGDAATSKEALVEGARQIAILPRSASTGNIRNLLNKAGSRLSDLPRGSHSAMHSMAIDDPFLSPTRDRESPGFSSTSMTPPEADRVQSIQAIKTPEQDISPRQDRLGQEVTPANAQGIHTPAACVFMANLSSQRTLDQLEYSVAKAMEIYGKSYVKVQYDKNKMPYAFVQFEKEEEARVCLTNAKGLVIDGRPIRVEHARAQRAVYLARITGGPVSDEEARNVLGRFGAIEETCQTTVADQQMRGLPEGCWVKFVYFMDCKDAIAEFRHNQFYKLFVQERNEDSPKVQSASPSMGLGSHRFRHPRDARAVFVGSLPNTITEDQLREVFNAYGSIVDCKVIRKSLGGGQINIFGFIEFRTATEAHAAQNARLSVVGVPLRVEPKRYTMRRATRNNVNNSPITFTSPSHQSPVYQGSGNRTRYDTDFAQMYNNNSNNTSLGYTTTQSPHMLPIRGGPPPHYGNQSSMSPYTQYPSPQYTSPLAPRGVGGGFDMTSPPPMYHGGGGPPNYYGSYMVGGPSGYDNMGPGGMQPIAEHEGEMGTGGF